MKELLIVVKALVLTVAAILIMQIQVGNETIEQKSEAWIKNSSFVGQLQEVADGAMVIFNKGLDKLDEVLSARHLEEGDAVVEQEPGRRQMSMRLERSKAFIEKQAKKAKSVAKKSLEAVQDEYFEETEELADEYLEEETE